MPNTFLNTGRTVVATSNPQNNVEQIQSGNQIPATQNNATVQPIQNNKQTGNAISPITIPIQLQPQIAQTLQVQPSSSIQQPHEQLQTTNNQVQSAPTPQTYQGQNNPSNIVDFNQIYSSYQNSFGNNAQNKGNTYSSGIKKTSIGTTIVTPTTNNLNSVQGQYQSAYSDTINSLISEMLTQMQNGFQYDPNNDEALKVATEYASNSTLQSLAGSGVLNSSATAERVARIVSELIPQYEEKAHGRWLEHLSQLADTAQIVMNYDAQQFEYWKDAKDREFQNKQFEYQKQQDALENAWKRVDELGYVDNNASAILGVPVGTLSGQARLAKEQREFELAKMREQAQIEYENNKALYKLKSELDLEQSKQLARNEYELAKQYGASKSGNSSSSDTVSLNTYKDIINNRWANRDDFSGKYTVSDNAGLYNYLVSEFSSGRMSTTDLATLTAMYNVTQPTDKDTAIAERKKYLESISKGV